MYCRFAAQNVRGGVKHIILVCGTAHAFLEDVYNIVPEARSRVLNIIDILGAKMSEEAVGEALVLGAEGTLKTQLYSKKMLEYGIRAIEPAPEYYEDIRCFIEMVKQNTFLEENIVKFINFLESYPYKNIILGCTEFPQLLKEIQLMDISLKTILDRYIFYDPLEAVLDELKKILI